MYSGTTFTNLSGSWLGVHQKLNRSARASMGKVTGLKRFPSAKQINHFEGKNGPDGIKSKSPSQDEPWHYYDPYDPDDTQLLELINQHYDALVEKLRQQDIEKAAFEAAWLSHALVDGLTPAHHYPYEEELERIRGSTKETRNTIRKKIVISGDTRREALKKNWMVWGPKGLITTHALFEWGVATVLLPYNKLNVNLTEQDLTQAAKLGLDELFAQSARKIAGQFAYDQFYQKGWTPSLARWTRSELAPEITKVVALGWYLALKQAGMVGRPRADV